MKIIGTIVLICLASACYTVDNPSNQLNSRIDILEKRIDSLVNAQKSDPVKPANPSAVRETGRCQAITKKGNQCKRKPKSNGYCWQHGGK